jgi:biotin carboxylase
VGSAGALEEIVAAQKRTLVVKPPDSRGARGVIRLLPDMDAAAVFAESAAQSPTGRVMVEQYLSGPQLSTESLVVDGRVHTIGLSDRNYEYLDRFAPYFIENGGDLPSRLSDPCLEKTRRLLERVAPALGIVDGVIKGDIVIVDGEPHIIEVAARLSGGYFCSHEIPLNTGVDFVGIAIDLALGRTIEPARLVPRFNQGVAQRYLFAAPGTVAALEGVEEAGKLEGVVHVELRVAVGEEIGAVRNHPSRAGVIIAVGDSRQQAIERVERAVNCIHIHTRETHQR